MERGEDPTLGTFLSLRDGEGRRPYPWNLSIPAGLRGEKTLPLEPLYSCGIERGEDPTLGTSLFLRDGEGKWIMMRKR
jgi:hypothetical protein